MQFVLCLFHNAGQTHTPPPPSPPRPPSIIHPPRPPSIIHPPRPPSHPHPHPPHRDSRKSRCCFL